MGRRSGLGEAGLQWQGEAEWFGADCGVEWSGLEWCGVVWCGMKQSGVERCGVVWSSVV